MSNEPCFIIAEAGSNHCGKIDLAYDLIEVASNAGADAVKFQLFDEKLYPKGSRASKEIAKWKMPENWIPSLFDYCKKYNIEFIATPFNNKAVDELYPYVKRFKVASFEITNLDLLDKISKTKKPVILSTGIATYEEIKNACDMFGDYSLLHCVSDYPADYKDTNLLVMNDLKMKFHCKVGFSDHTLGIEASIAAVALGAEIIEKHFKLDKQPYSPDAEFAIDPKMLNSMVKGIRNVQKMLGDKRYISDLRKLRSQKVGDQFMRVAD